METLFGYLVVSVIALFQVRDYASDKPSRSDLTKSEK